MLLYTSKPDILATSGERWKPFDTSGYTRKWDPCDLFGGVYILYDETRLIVPFGRPAFEVILDGRLCKYPYSASGSIQSIQRTTTTHGQETG